MLRRTITYTNLFTDQKVTETHHFHISKTDLVEMELEEHGAPAYVKDGEELVGMRAKLARMVDSEDGKAIMAEIKDLIRRSYGKKDGDRFLKSPEIWDDFASSEAFSQLFFELCTHADAAAEFISGVIPHNLDQIAAEIKEQAEKVAKGREAQAVAKAAGSGHPSDPAATPVEGQLSEGTGAVMDALSDAAPEPSLADRIDNATAENPVTLTEADVRGIDSDILKSGLATGRIKIS